MTVALEELMPGAFGKPTIVCWICWSLEGAETVWGLLWGGGALPASPKGSLSSQPGSGAPEAAPDPGFIKAATVCYQRCWLL